jgi:hypothetical protein
MDRPIGLTPPSSRTILVSAARSKQTNSDTKIDRLLEMPDSDSVAIPPAGHDSSESGSRNARGFPSRNSQDRRPRVLIPLCLWDKDLFRGNAYVLRSSSTGHRSTQSKDAPLIHGRCSVYDPPVKSTSRRYTQEKGEREGDALCSSGGCWYHRLDCSESSPG